MAKTHEPEVQQQSTAVAKRGEFAVLAMDTNQIQEIVATNLGGQGLTAFDLDRIKVPSGGGLYWSVPTLDGEEEAKEIIGVVIHHRPVRGYWKERFAGAKNPPDCHSDDGISGFGQPGGTCRKCPLAQYGTAVNEKGQPAKGQACKQMKFLFVIREGDILPILVVLPPTSLKPVEKYLMRLTSQAVPFYGVVTRLTLERTKSSIGIDFSRVVPAMVGKLDQEQLAKMKTLVVSMRSAFDAVTIEAGDYPVEDPAAGQ
jgi:hypothetical protein